MVKLSKHSPSSAGGKAPATSSSIGINKPSGLKKRPSILLSLFKRPAFIKNGLSKSGSKQTEQEKRAAIRESMRQAGRRNGRGASLEDLVRAINRADRVTGLEMQRTRKVKRASAPRHGNDELVFFRCDIHGTNGNDFTEAERECKQLVREAGGTVMVEYEYIGGFLYNFPADMGFANPLSDNDETEGGGHIKVSPWKPFITKRLDPLRMNPPDHLTTPVASRDVDESEDDHDKEDKDKNRVERSEKGKTSRIRLESWIQAQKEQAEREDTDASFLSTRENFDDDLALSPRILDPGVELAILDPNLISSGVSQSRMSVLRSGSRASWCEKEVYYPNGTGQDDEWDDAKTLSVAKSLSAKSMSSISSQRYSGVEATALSVRRATPVVVRNFGEEMARLGEVYRNWVPAMTSACRLADQGGSD